jgi:ribosome recycling factor
MIELVLTDQNTKEFEKLIQEEMNKPIKHFERELITIRTGRAHPSLVEDLPIACYGGTSTMKLREIASIAVPDVRLITIQPWDQSLIGDIEKSIKASSLGVTPVNDGTLIRIPLPEMSSDRREELVKILKKKQEDAKVQVRTLRKDFNNLIRDSLKNKSISEDHSRRLNDLLQKLTDQFTDRIDTMAEKKAEGIKLI